MEPLGSQSSFAAVGRRLPLVMVISGILVMVLAPWWMAYSECDKAEFFELREVALAQSEELLSAIEAFQAENGRYPGDLASLRLPKSSLRLACGTRWTYVRSPDGGNYTLKLGDYDKNGFCVYRYGSSDSWVIDD